jgi:predicted O-linked N-acetylglucosamine transferase (SPINDLY family)
MMLQSETAAVETASAGAATLPSAHENPDAMVQEALALHRQGKIDEAEAIYRRVLDAHPDHSDALHLFGALLLQRGRIDESIASLRRSVEIKPHYPEAHNNLAIALQKRGETEQALAHWEKAVTQKPEYAQAYSNYAKALAEQGRAGMALACWQRAVALDPNDVMAHGDFATALQKLNRFDEAAANYDRALALKPDNVEMHCGYAAALRGAGRPAEAIARYQKALLLAPDHLGAHAGLAGVLESEGRTGDATLHYERALALKPDLAELRFRLCTAQLPVIYLDEAEIEGRRIAYRKRLERLSADFESGAPIGDVAAVVGNNQPFYLPYQGQCDRELQSTYGAMVCKAMAAKYPPPEMPPPPAPGEKIRVGIVSGLFRHHTVWKLMIRGWLSQLDREKFEVFCYHTNDTKDAQTEIAVKQATRFVQGPLPGPRWREEILADRPHVLIYPDIGMDPVSGWIAANRLAPTQCVTWGHPNTTGYPTIDYFLSSDLMEPPDGDQHYSEKLVRLPNLSIYYEPLDVRPAPLTRANMGLRPSAVAYWCGQSLFKYLPQYDQVFARIAREVPDCQFVFIQSHHGDPMTQRFGRRLERAFAVQGLDAAKHIHFVPRLGLEQFIGAIGQCDVVLDSLGWSGGNTTLEGLAHDTPIVTHGGPLMRGRHTMAILQRMGVTETIAATVDDYVAIAARLGREPEWRAEVKRRIGDNKHLVFRDSEAIRGLEEFFARAARGEAAPGDGASGETPAGAIALDPTVILDFPLRSGAPLGEPGDEEPDIAPPRAAPNRHQRRGLPAAMNISTIMDSKQRRRDLAGMFFSEGA